MPSYGFSFSFLFSPVPFSFSLLVAASEKQGVDSFRKKVDDAVDGTPHFLLVRFSFLPVNSCMCERMSRKSLFPIACPEARNCMTLNNKM